MANFVIGNQPLAATIGEGLALHARNHPIDRIIDFGDGGGLLAAAGGENGGFVEQVGQVGTGKAGSAAGNGFERDGLGEFLVAAVDFQNRKAAFDVRGINADLAIKAAGTHQGRIEHIGAVGGRNDDDAAVAFKAIHLGEQLVEGLLPFVVAATDASAPLSAHRIDFIDEDQARAVFLGALEKVTHPTGANPHEHFDKFGARKRKEGNARLTGDGFGKQRFARAWGAHQQHSPWNLCPHRSEALGSLEEGHDLLKVLFGLFDSGHVGELDTGFSLHLETGLGLAELHRLARATGHAGGTAGQKDQ